GLRGAQAADRGAIDGHVEVRAPGPFSTENRLCLRQIVAPSFAVARLMEPARLVEREEFRARTVVVRIGHLQRAGYLHLADGDTGALADRGDARGRLEHDRVVAGVPAGAQVAAHAIFAAARGARQRPVEEARQIGGGLERAARLRLETNADRPR